MSEKILVGIDGTEDNSRAVNYAVNWAKKRKAKLIMVYVIKRSTFTFQNPEENEERHKRSK